MQCIAETRADPQRGADRAHSPLIGKVQANLARHARVDIGILSCKLLGNARLGSCRSPRFHHTPRLLDAGIALDNSAVRIRARHSFRARHSAADKGGA